MKTPRTDKALEAVADMLPTLPLGGEGRHEISLALAQIRGVPSAVVRCSGALSIIDDLIRKASHSEALHALTSALVLLRNLRKGLDAELNQARARAAANC